MRSLRVCLIGLLVLAGQVLALGVARADDDHSKDKDNDPHGAPVADFVEGNPDLFPDAFITDAQENQDVPPCAGKTYHSALVGPPSGPLPVSQHAYQLVLAIPSGKAVASGLDRPASCSDGTKVLSAVAWASRNLATFQYNRSANLNYRTLSQTYTHAYTGSSFNTRAVRRFYSIQDEAWWNERPMDASLTG